MGTTGHYPCWLVDLQKALVATTLSTHTCALQVQVDFQTLVEGDGMAGDAMGPIMEGFMFALNQAGAPRGGGPVDADAARFVPAVKPNMVSHNMSLPNPQIP
jgi:hypothetical protein